MGRRKQETLVLFPEIIDTTAKLTDKQFGILIRAAFAYRFQGIYYDGGDPLVDMAFAFLANQIDRHAEVCKTNADNAAKCSEMQRNTSQVQRNAAKCSEMQRNDPPIQSNPIQSNPIHDNRAVTPPSRPRFVKPTVEEVADYCRENGYAVDAQHFIDHYSANGWKVGRNAMKDWKAAVRTWVKRDTKEMPGKTGAAKPSAIAMAAIQRMLEEEG